MMLTYAPVVLIQKLIPNIFVSGFANGLTQLATIPFMPYINKNVSRRKGLMTIFSLATIFTLIQYFLNPAGCLNCLKGNQFVLLMIAFTIARFFTNLASNFNINVVSEPFPSQVRAICYCGALSIGRFSNVFIPLIPAFTTALSIPYNILYAMIGLMGVAGGFFLR